jgi:ABC-type molybdate transport system substrate-binding protein
MLDPDVKLGTSTPNADPSGDYAWLAFERAEKIRPGSYAKLDAKARKLTGGKDSPQPKPGRNLYADLMSSGQADLFLTYCTNAALVIKEEPALKRVALPASLAVGADYGLTVLKGAGSRARLFADYLLAPEAQRVFAAHGFMTVGK